MSTKDRQFIPESHGKESLLSPKHSHKILFIVVVFAFILRVIVVFLAPTQFSFPDSQEYHQVAQNILQGKGIVLDSQWQATRPPLYPIFLAFLYFLKADILVVKLFQALLGALLLIPVYLFVHQLSKNYNVALCSVVLAAVDPLQIAFCALVLTETLSTCLLFFAVWGLYSTYEKNSNKWAVFTGAVLALGTLCRSAQLLFIVPLLLYAIIVYGRKRKWTLHVFLVVAFACLLLPWTIRNWFLYQRFVPTTTQMGIALYEALGPGATGAPRMDKMQLPPEANDLPEIERDAFLRQWTIAYVVEHPVEGLQISLNKARRFWNVSLNYPPLRRHLANWGIIIFCVFVYLAAIYGITKISLQNLLLLLLPIAYVACLHMVFLGSVRYRVPIMVFIEMIAAYGIVAFYMQMRTRFTRESSILV